MYWLAVPDAESTSPLPLTFKTLHDLQAQQHRPWYLSDECQLTSYVNRPLRSFKCVLSSTNSRLRDGSFTDAGRPTCNSHSFIHSFIVHETDANYSKCNTM